MSERKFSYKPNRPQPDLPAEDVGAELDRIRSEHGELTPKVVVDSSRDKRAVLHEELDLHLAAKERAELWSRHKARNIINVVMVVPERPDGAKDETAVPAFVNITVGPADDPESRRYEPVEEVLADPVKRAALVQRALEKLVRVQKEFRHLRELESVWSAIESVLIAQGE